MRGFLGSKSRPSTRAPKCLLKKQEITNLQCRVIRLRAELLCGPFSLRANEPAEISILSAADEGKRRLPLRSPILSQPKSLYFRVSNS